MIIQPFYSSHSTCLLEIFEFNLIKIHMHVLGTLFLKQQIERSVFRRK